MVPLHVLRVPTALRPLGYPTIANPREVRYRYSVGTVRIFGADHLRRRRRCPAAPAPLPF